MRKSNTLVLAPWVGGLNSSEDPIVLGLSPQGQQLLARADNIVFTTTGGRRKRGGQSRFNSAAQMTDAGSAVDGVYATTYWFNNSNNIKVEELVVLTERSTIYYGPSYGSLQALTISAVSPVFSQGVVSTDVMNEKLFIGYSKTAAPLYYGGAGGVVGAGSNNTSVVGTFPNGYLVRQHVNRLFIAGDAAHPDRLYYSGVELPFAHSSAGGFIDILPGDGDPQGITSIFPPTNVNELYISKRSAIYKIDTSDSNPNNWSVITVSKGVGCVQHNSVAAVDQGDIIFASDRGIHSLQQVLSQTGVLVGKFLSQPIQDQYNSSTNRRLISGIWAPDLNSYLFSIQREGTSIIDTVYGYNVSLGNWYRWTEVPANFLFKRLNTSTEEYEYYSCGDSTSNSNRGYINKLQQSSKWDFSSATGNIVTIIDTPLLYPGGNFPSENNFLNIILLVRSSDESPIQVNCTIDELTSVSGVLTQRVIGGNLLGSSSSFLLGTTFVLGAPSGAKPLYLHIGGVGNAIKVSLRHDTIGGEFEAYALGVECVGSEESQDAYRAFPR